jgi:hypothetical protein
MHFFTPLCLRGIVGGRSLARALRTRRALPAETRGVVLQAAATEYSNEEQA